MNLSISYDGEIDLVPFLPCLRLIGLLSIATSVTSLTFAAGRIVNGAVMSLDIWDTAGIDICNQLRQLACSESHVVVLCCNIDWKSSLAISTTR